MEKGSTKIVLTLEYDGTNYFGFQLQANKPGQPTIQSELEKAIYCLSGEEVRVLAASRTDAGVHAKGQVVSFRTHSLLSTDTFLKGLNFYLPEDIAVRQAYRANDDFNVRRDASSREYEYYILNSDTRSPIQRRFALQFWPFLDADMMNRASNVLVGEHDFVSFTGNIGDSIRTIRKVFQSEVKRNEDNVVFCMKSNSFLPHQIRNTVGALIRVGLGKMNVNEFYDIMETRKFGLAGPRVSPRGLFLMRVNYSRPFGEEN